MGKRIFFLNKSCYNNPYLTKNQFLTFLKLQGQSRHPRLPPQNGSLRNFVSHQIDENNVCDCNFNQNCIIYVHDVYRLCYHWYLVSRYCWYDEIILCYLDRNYLQRLAGKLYFPSRMLSYINFISLLLLFYIDVRYIYRHYSGEPSFVPRRVCRLLVYPTNYDSTSLILL